MDVKLINLRLSVNGYILINLWLSVNGYILHIINLWLSVNGYILHITDPIAWMKLFNFSRYTLYINLVFLQSKSSEQINRSQFTPVFSGVRVSWSLVFCIMFCIMLFVLLFFFCFVWPLHRLSFFDLRLLIFSLVSSNFLLKEYPNQKH